MKLCIIGLLLCFLCAFDVALASTMVDENSDSAVIQAFIARGKQVKNPTTKQLIALGSALMWTKQYDEALDAASKAVAREPRNADAHALRGQILKATKRFAESLPVLNKSLELDSNQPGLLTDRAFVKIQLGDWKGALVDVKKDLDGSPRKSQSWYVKGLAEYSGGETDNSIESLSKAIELDRNFAPAIKLRGVQLHNLGKVADAEKDLQRAAALKQK